MTCNPRYEILFEPMRIGPVTAPNRFYQVPHASGMTNALPRVRAAFREAKAEGGWGVICTGACSIDPSSDDAPLPFATLWDDNDIRAHALMTEAVHRHGSLAGVELWHGGASVMNRASRLPPLSPSGIPWMATHVGFMGNLRPKTMDKADIREVLRCQAEAARKARTAGFDVVYVYAGMGYLGYEFLLPEYNHRSDEYGGSIENRVRFVREMIEVTKDAVGKDCGVALRVSLEELRSRPGRNQPSEAHELIELLADLPDLFDVKMDSSPTDCSASRFTGEGSHEPVVDFVKSLTKKPVVGVGRFTSPDTMVAQIKRGVLDFIGGARPSIADPFLPAKIREGREAEIRECIGCNICISSWHDGVPVRCTQNPTAGEEWRRGWHPERVERTDAPERILIVGGGPAGLECALTLGRRGHEVTLADSSRSFGGRLTFEKTLPGLSAWNRVVEYRLGRLDEMSNVSLYPESTLGVDEIIDLAPERDRACLHLRQRVGSALPCAVGPAALGDPKSSPRRHRRPASAGTNAGLRFRQLLHGRRPHRASRRAWHSGQLCDLRRPGVSLDDHDQRIAAGASRAGTAQGAGDDAASAEILRRRDGDAGASVHRRREPHCLPLGADRWAAPAAQRTVRGADGTHQ